MILTGINFLLIAVLFGMIYHAYKMQNSLRKIKDAEDEYLASIARSVQYSYDYNELMKKQIDEIKAKMLYDKFMMQARKKNEQ